MASGEKSWGGIRVDVIEIFHLSPFSCDVGIYRSRIGGDEDARGGKMGSISFIYVNYNAVDSVFQVPQDCFISANVPKSHTFFLRPPQLEIAKRKRR